MSDWLAVGDETGNWDELRNPGAFLGVALVMGRIEDWQAALEEQVDDQRIQDRLQAPPRRLPQAYRKSGQHHLLDAFTYWQSQKLAGEWSLDAPGDDPLRQEVFATLRWLAEHPRLITLGLWGRGATLQAALFGSEDSAIALGRAYGLLAALALPFLNPSDRLLIHPGLRSESRYSIAQQRAKLNSAPETEEARQSGYVRGTLSMIREEIQRHGQMWRGGAVARFDVGTLDYLRNNSPALKTARLDNRLLNVVADLGAGLLRLTSQPGTQGVSLRRDDAWRNVVFHKLPEITA